MVQKTFLTKADGRWSARSSRLGLAVTARLVVHSVVFVVIVVSVVFGVMFAVAVHPVEGVGRTRVRAYDRDAAEQRDNHDRGGHESE